MVKTDIITAIENKDYLRSTELLERSLYQKAGVILEEKKKQVVAKTWKAIDTLPGSDEKAKLNASRRKAFKDKMKHLKHGENKEQHEDAKAGK
jgi:hypothetical protein